MRKKRKIYKEEVIKKYMDVNNKENIIFVIRTEDLQNEAVMNIGRELNEEEILSASKGIEAGLSFDIDTVYKSAINEAVG